MKLTLPQMVKALPKVARASVTAESALSELRRSICNRCPFLQANRQCSQCGCFVDLKTKLPDEKCPVGKW